MSSLGNERVELFDMGAGPCKPIADENVRMASELDDFRTVMKKLIVHQYLNQLTFAPPESLKKLKGVGKERIDSILSARQNFGPLPFTCIGDMPKHISNVLSHKHAVRFIKDAIPDVPKLSSETEE